MTNADTSLSNIFETLTSLGIDKIYGWDIKIWANIYCKCNNTIMEEWHSHIKECINKNTSYDAKHESIRIKNEIESFAKRSEINALFYCFLNSR